MALPQKPSHDAADEALPSPLAHAAMEAFPDPELEQLDRLLGLRDEPLPALEPPSSPTQEVKETPSEDEDIALPDLEEEPLGSTVGDGSSSALPQLDADFEAKDDDELVKELLAKSGDWGDYEEELPSLPPLSISEEALDTSQSASLTPLILASFPEDEELPALEFPTSEPAPASVSDEEELLIEDWDTLLEEEQEAEDELAALPANIAALLQDEEDEEEEPEDATWDETDEESDEAIEQIPDWDEEDDEDNEQESPLEEDFVPPANPFSSPSELAEPEAEEAQETEEQAPPKKTRLSGKQPTKEKPAAGFKKLLAQARAELQGKDAPDDEVDEQEADEEEQRHEPKTRVPKGKNSNPFMTLLLLPKRLYVGLTKIIFNILKGFIGLLASIPLIGWPFKQLLKVVRVLEAIAMALPLLFLVAGCIVASYLAVPREASIELPDSGAASFSDFSYDASTGEARGVILNEGEIIAEATPAFTLWSIQPELNPLTWFMPQEAGACVVEPVEVAIDGTLEVAANCELTSGGFLPRASGELS